VRATTVLRRPYPLCEGRSQGQGLEQFCKLGEKDWTRGSRGQMRGGVPRKTAPRRETARIPWDRSAPSLVIPFLPREGSTRKVRKRSRSVKRTSANGSAFRPTEREKADSATPGFVTLTGLSSFHCLGLPIPTNVAPHERGCRAVRGISGETFEIRVRFDVSGSSLGAVREAGAQG
jgi:hypothetical protein